MNTTMTHPQIWGTPGFFTGGGKLSKSGMKVLRFYIFGFIEREPL
jgi:hypothetical protein